MVDDPDSPSMETDDPTQTIQQAKKYYIDTVNLKVPRKGMDMTSCLDDGMGNESGNQMKKKKCRMQCILLAVE